MIKFVKVNDPIPIKEAEVIGPDYVFKNLALTHNGVQSLGEVNALVLKEALINTPELLAKWGLKLVPLKKEPPVKQGEIKFVEPPKETTFIPNPMKEENKE